MRIIIYTKKACMQCQATKLAFDRHDIPYQLINVDEQPAVLVQLQNLGYRQLPVVMAEGDAWSGFRPDKILNLTLPAAG